MATQTQVKEFIEKIAPIIQKYAKKNEYKICSTVIAQACCESAYGTSSLGYKYHNYFGMKCGSVWKGASVNMKTKEEYTPGTLTSIKDNFRAYFSMEEGVKGYFDFISAKRYANLKTATTYRQYAEFLKADGYATSSTYVNTLCTIVEKYNLTQYDDFFSVNVTPVTPVQTQKSPFVVGKNYKLKYNMWVRSSANGQKQSWSKLTKNGQKVSIRQSDGTAVMKKGTIITCQDVMTVANGGVWVKFPSGWVCGLDSDGTQYLG